MRKLGTLLQNWMGKVSILTLSVLALGELLTPKFNTCILITPNKVAANTSRPPEFSYVTRGESSPCQDDNVAVQCSVLMSVRLQGYIVCVCIITQDIMYTCWVLYAQGKTNASFLPVVVNYEMISMECASCELFPCECICLAFQKLLENNVNGNRGTLKNSGLA